MKTIGQILFESRFPLGVTRRNGMTVIFSDLPEVTRRTYEGKAEAYEKLRAEEMGARTEPCQTKWRGGGSITGEELFRRRFPSSSGYHYLEANMLFWETLANAANTGRLTKEDGDVLAPCVACAELKQRFASARSKDGYASDSPTSRSRVLDQPDPKKKLTVLVDQDD